MMFSAFYLFLFCVDSGGCDDTKKAHLENRLMSMIASEDSGNTDYEYDLIVIGGGSGGLAAAKVTCQMLLLT